ncbi:protein-glutamate O-methyltransferase CheR [Bacillaceae bacterium Marseille-Q3522]|nr:protein-glutamate O-methyltransferase CheR [Bacillaceae bacterium Marseille-Q3522]
MQEDYNEFIAKIKYKTGIDLASYKEAQMKRRLKSFYEKKGYQSFAEFYLAISRDVNVLNEFLNRMTINVSEFYRNRNRWDIFEEKILPQILKQNKRPKIWSAACSTGEEPYTITMILSKFMPLSQIHILATDIDEDVIKKAKTGVYPEKALQEMPHEMKAKYLHRDGDVYKISERIRQKVTFQKHNLLADPFGGPYDLIVCRNVLIYFTEKAKESLYLKFSQALKPNGFFFVGSTEQIFNPAQYGMQTEKTFFYRRLTGCNFPNLER